MRAAAGQFTRSAGKRTARPANSAFIVCQRHNPAGLSYGFHKETFARRPQSPFENCPAEQWDYHVPYNGGGFRAAKTPSPSAASGDGMLGSVSVSIFLR
jgi:hypothetical protein